MLKITNFTKKYGDTVAVDNLSLEINAGEIYGFIGHNGAGKTTTLKAVVGIHGFDEGEILVNGISVKENPIEAKKQLAYIPDNPDLYDYMTGIQYLEFISNIFNVTTEDRKTKIEKFAETLEIKDSLNQDIASYSHGMKQKLAIIGALVHDPKLIIMDEPFVGLDPKASFQLKQVMKEMCSQGSAIFFSTHVLDTAEKLCDKVAIIKNGKLIKCGTMEEVKGDESLEEAFLELEKDNA